MDKSPSEAFTCLEGSLLEYLGLSESKSQRHRLAICIIFSKHKGDKANYHNSPGMFLASVTGKILP